MENVDSVAAESKVSVMASLGSLFSIKSRLARPRRVEPNGDVPPLMVKARTWEEFVAETENLLILETRSYGPGAQWLQTTYQPIGSVFIHEREHTPWNFFAKPAP